MEFDSYERYLDFETGVLHRVSSQVHLAEWFGLGSHFGEKYGLYFKKHAMLISGTLSEHGFSPPNITGSLKQWGVWVGEDLLGFHTFMNMFI